METVLQASTKDFNSDDLRHVELLDAAQMQAVDQRAITQGLDSFALMQHAAQAVSEQVRKLLKKPELAESEHRSILVLAGPGNNGGDGLVAAALLRGMGYATSVLRIGPLPTASSDAGKALALWNESCLSLDSAQLPGLLDSVTVIVDALFGAGLSRALDPSVADLVDRVNAASAHVLAVDVPSGLDGNRHQAFMPCIQAHSTITFFRFKPAHVLYPGRALCGKKSLVQIGLSDQQLEHGRAVCVVNTPDVFRCSLPRLTPTSHKFDRGHVLVRGGPIHATGAARLSAGTALYSGAGLVTLATQTSALAVNACHLTAVMLTACDDRHDWQTLLKDQRINSLVIGPGNGLNDDTREAVELALQSTQACVLDADAISCWQGRGEYILPLLAASTAEVVLTPHAGEFTRLFGAVEQVTDLPSRLHQARAAARLCSSTIILKGADTVVAAPDGRACININASPWLATAGAGDVLAGLLASLIAQGMPAFEAACAAVWLHGSAATRLGYPMCAEQLVEQVGVELSELATGLE